MKQFYNIATKVSSRKKCYYFWWSTWLIKARMKKISKLRVTGLCEGNSPWTGEFPAQRAGNAENISIWWRHHVLYCSSLVFWYRAESRFAPSQWETALHYNDVSLAERKHGISTLILDSATCLQKYVSPFPIISTNYRICSALVAVVYTNPWIFYLTTLRCRHHDIVTLNGAVEIGHYWRRLVDCLAIESMKTTSMENVSTGIRNKNKEHYSRSKDKAANHMMYWGIYNCIGQNTKKWRFTIHYAKPTAQLLFKSRVPKSGQTCRKQVVNPRHQTPHGQSVATPGTSLQNIQVE